VNIRSIVEQGTVGERLQFELDQLSNVHEAMTPDVASYHAEACATSLVKSGHNSGVELKVSNDGSDCTVHVVWDRQIGERQFMAHGDEKRRTDDASVALALGVVHTLLGVRAVERSKTTIFLLQMTTISSSIRDPA